MKKHHFLIGIIALIGIFIISGCSTNLGACTEEAKVCPDGTSVVRNPNNDCEFDPCPDVDKEELSGVRAPQIFKDAVNNPSLCESAPSSGAEFTKDICYLYVAQVNKDIDVCNHIGIDDLREDCISQLAYNLYNPEDCEKLDNPKGFFYDRTVCFTNAAKYFEDEGLCFKAGPSNDDECERIMRPSIEKGWDNEENLNKCKEHVAYSKNSCLFEVAALKNNLTICDEMLVAGLVDYKLFCYDKVAIVTQDSSICRTIQCISRVAVDTKDKQLCEQILNQNYIAGVTDLSYAHISLNLDVRNPTDAQIRNFTLESCIKDVIEFYTIELLEEIDSLNVTSFDDGKLMDLVYKLKILWGDTPPFYLFHTILANGFPVKGNSVTRFVIVDAIGSTRMSMTKTERLNFINLFERIIVDDSYESSTRAMVLTRLTNLYITSEEQGWIGISKISHYLEFLKSLDSPNTPSEIKEIAENEKPTIYRFYPELNETFMKEQGLIPHAPPTPIPKD